MKRDYVSGDVVGAYEIQGEIGRGGMGVVYKAFQTSLQRTVALKGIPGHLSRNPELVTRFRREALATARLNHSGIVQIYDYCESEDETFYVMEYLDPREWRSLRETLDREVLLPLDTALNITLKLLTALKAAHQEGLIHRDLKPANIMVNSAGDIKILDFGIALIKDRTRMTVDNNVPSGTVDYMSPEQGEGKEIDQRSDIYSVGTILYEMLTGVLPFQADNPVVILRLRSEKDPAPIRQINEDLPADIETYVCRAMTRDPNDRYPSAQHMITDIERHMRQRPFEVSLPRRAEPEVKSLRESPGRMVLEINCESGRRFRVAFYADDGSVRTVSQYESVDVNPADVDEWCEKTTRIIRKANIAGGGTVTLLEDLKRIGQRMYDHLLPLEAKKALQRSGAKYLLLRLDDYAVKVPWELLYDGVQFLCRRFNCGRIITTAHAIQPVTGRDLGAMARILIVGNPRGDLKAAGDESLFLKQQCAHLPAAQIRLRQGRVTAEELESDLREADIVHYSGHAVFDERDPSKSGWVLSDRVFGAGNVQRLQGSQAPLPLLIFANACQSAYQEGEEGDAGKQLYNLAKAYLLAGVQTYIGAFAEILDAHAAEFALVFYRELFRGRSLGDALRMAREHIIGEYGEESLIWANYVMYGNPARTLISSAKLEEPQEAPVLPEPEIKTAPEPALAGAIRGAAPALAAVKSRPEPRPKRRHAWPIVLVLAILAGGLWWLSTFHKPASDSALSQAYAALRNGEFAAAEEMFNSGSSPSGLPRAKEGLAALALKQNRLEEAASLADQAIGLDAEAVYARVIRGLALFANGEMAQAEEAFRYAIAKNMEYAWQRAEALTGLGRVLLAKNQTNEAVTALEEANRLDPESPETTRALAETYVKSGRDEDALKLYDQLARSRPEDKWIRFMIRDLERRRDSEEKKQAHERVQALLASLEAAPRETPSATEDVWTSRVLGIAILPARINTAGNETIQEGEPEFFAFTMEEELGASSRVHVVDRNLLDAALTEMRMTQDQLTATDGSVRLGRVLSARLLLTTTLFHLPGTVRASCRVIDTETTENIATFSAESSTGVEGLAGPLTETLLAKIAEAYPLQGRVKQLTSPDEVELNIGTRHGVREGLVFEVFPTGNEQQVIARLKVARISAASCAAGFDGPHEAVTADCRVREMIQKAE